MWCRFGEQRGERAKAIDVGILAEGDRAALVGAEHVTSVVTALALPMLSVTLSSVCVPARSSVAAAPVRSIVPGEAPSVPVTVSPLAMVTLIARVYQFDRSLVGHAVERAAIEREAVAVGIDDRAAADGAAADQGDRAPVWCRCRPPGFCRHC